MAVIERRTGRRPAAGTVSRDGRMARDWVPQYADIIRALPAQALAAHAHGRQLRRARQGVRQTRQAAQERPPPLSVFAAVGYEQHNRRGKLWYAEAFPGESERHWREFFSRLAGQPEVVVCDGSIPLRNATAWAFPHARVYPCAWHLFDGLRRHVIRAGLYNRRRRIYKALRPQDADIFWRGDLWRDCWQVIERYLAADLSKADPKTVQAPTSPSGKPVTRRSSSTTSPARRTGRSTSATSKNTSTPSEPASATAAAPSATSTASTPYSS
jgi:hypothetical protein